MMRTIVSIGEQLGSPQAALKIRAGWIRAAGSAQRAPEATEKHGARKNTARGKTRHPEKHGTEKHDAGAVRHVIGPATYLLNVHDAASRREMVRGDVTFDPALCFEESSLWRERVGDKQISVRVWVRAKGRGNCVRTPENLARCGGSTHLATLVLLRLRGGGQLKGKLHHRNARWSVRAPKCGSRRGSSRSSKCAARESNELCVSPETSARFPLVKDLRTKPHFETRVRRAVCVPRHARTATTSVQTRGAYVSNRREVRSGSSISLASLAGGLSLSVRSIVCSRIASHSEEPSQTQAWRSLAA